MAQSCLSAKQYACAQEQFRQILLQNPDSASAHMLLGRALDGLERTPEAIAEFQAAARISPREPSVHFGLGYLYWESSQYNQAKEEFNAELAIDPKHAEAIAYLGDIALKNNDPGAALPLLKKATDLRNDIRFTYIDLGAIYADKKMYPEATKALQRAVELDRTQSDAHYRLAKVYKAMGNEPQAQQEFAKIRELENNPRTNPASKAKPDQPPPDQPQ